MSEASNPSFHGIRLSHSSCERVKPPGVTRDRYRNVALTQPTETHAMQGAMTCSFSFSCGVKEQGLQTPFIFDPFNYCMCYRPGVPLATPLTGSFLSRNNASASGAPHSGGGEEEGSCGAGAPCERPRNSVEEATFRCRCSLNVGNLFENPLVDIPNPAPPLSKCELHEILRSLPPRFQNHPWRLCYDTARDGSSLRNFYRAMEHVYQSGESGLGILLLTARQQDTAVRDPCEADAAAEKVVKRAQKQRKPMAIVGCFAPKVPCLESHEGGQHAFYGSPETFVFRLRLAGKHISFSGLRDQAAIASATTQQGVPPRAELTAPESSPAGDRLPSSQDAVTKGDPRVRRADDGGGVGGGLSLRPPRAARSPPVPSNRSLFVDEDASSQLLPMATRHTRRNHAEKPVEEEGQSADTSTACPHESHTVTPTYTASPAARGFSDTGAAGRPEGEGVDGVRARDGAWADEAAPASSDEPLTLPAHVPLLQKFAWCGNPRKRQFVLAQNHCFAIGGGRDGAALYVDDNLQYCTSSAHCETFDCPPLFGSQPPAGLKHTEAVVVRMLWFAVREGRDVPTAQSSSSRKGGRGSFRMMTFTTEEEEERAAREGRTVEEVSQCLCGRRCPERGDVCGAGEVGHTRLPTHKCNEGFFAF